MKKEKSSKKTMFSKSSKVVVPELMGEITKDEKIEAEQDFFSAEDLLRIEVGQLRVDNVLKQGQIAEAALAKFVSEANDTIRKSETVIVELRKSASDKISELNVLYSELESKYSLSMKEIKYDSDTGKIRRNASI